jgi:hypothetical protein
MQRLARIALPLGLLIAIILIAGFLVEDSRAELENQVFTSRGDRLRIVVPRGWRATDHPTYPGLVLWMMRTQPPGQIVLSSEAFTRALYCSWPITCRSASDTPTNKYACALREKLQAQRLRVGPTQAGPKENEAAGISSIWFEYDDGKRFLRQAIAVTNDRAISLVLSAPTLEARSTHVRPFDQALRTLRFLSAAEAAPPGSDAALALAANDGVVVDTIAPPAPPADGPPPTDAGAILDGAKPTTNTVTFESAPAPKIEPIGPCPK